MFTIKRYAKRIAVVTTVAALAVAASPAGQALATITTVHHDM